MSWPIFERTEQFGIASLNDQQIFLTGGSGNGHTYTSVFCYSVKNDKWTNVMSMNKRRYGHSSCALGDFLYVYGGIG